MAHPSKRLITALLFAAWCTGTNPVAASDTQFAVIELFTSQGCYSCPPADALLGDLIHSDRRIIGLEFHVDYWDELTYGHAGKWKDPFSDPRYTDRQRKYHGQRLSGQRGVYTPQAIINGRFATVGTNRRAIESALNDAAAQSSQMDISLRKHSDRGLTVSVNGDAKQSAAVWLMIFDHKRVTSVRNGENQGKTLTNHNVIREMKHIGNWHGQPVSVSIADIAMADDQGCAIVVQQADQGPILGATLC